MTKKSFAVLCAVTAVAVALAVFAMSGRPQLEAGDHLGTRVFPTLVKDAETLKTVAIHRGGETLNFDWDGKMWRARERGNYPADPEKLTGLIVNLARMTKVEGKTRLPDRYARLEVEDPASKDAKSRQVALIDVNGKEIASLIVGKRQTALGNTEGGTYVRLADDPQVWLVTGEITAEATAGDWLRKDIIDIKEPAIARVTVTHPNGEKIVVGRTPNGQNFNIENLPKGAQPASFYIADEYGRLLTGMMLEDVAPAASKTFPKDKTVTAVVEGGDGFEVVIETAEIDGQSWVKIKGTPPPADKPDADAAKAVDLRTDWAKLIGDMNARAEGWVYQVPAFQVAPLKRRMADLLKKPEAKSSAPVSGG
jgi:hypothetical protein